MRDLCVSHPPARVLLCIWQRRHLKAKLLRYSSCWEKLHQVWYCDAGCQTADIPDTNINDAENLFKDVHFVLTEDGLVSLFVVSDLPVPRKPLVLAYHIGKISHLLGSSVEFRCVLELLLESRDLMEILRFHCVHRCF